MAELKHVPADLKTNPIITKHPNNPVVKADDVPYDAALVFNAGVTRFQGKYVMVFRNDYDFSPESFKPFLEGTGSWPKSKTNIGLAYSDDGVKWEVEPKPCFSVADVGDDDVKRAYDPRLTVIDGRCYMCFAIDTNHGLRGGIAVTDDFDKWEILSMTVPDNRNMVLFPEKLGGKYVRLERPMPIYSRNGLDRFDTWISDSPDCRYWGNSKLVLAVEDVGFANDKVGPAAPPVKTDKGWLTVFHAVDKDDSRDWGSWHGSWTKRYTAGVMLLDLDDPGKIVGKSEVPLIAPDSSYELENGFRNGVIFPCGAILEKSGEMKIYYGAADTCTCLATASVEDLIAACL